jgi:hypothetical protein
MTRGWSKKEFGQRMQHEQAEMITVDVARGGGLLLVST